MARTRRSAPEARRVILEAAEKRLREGGPEAVRLQDLARDLGVSHPAILHHFGSRDGLMRALAAHVVATLEGEMLATLRAAQSEETVLDVLGRVFETIGDARHARLLAWRALAGESAPGPGEARQGLAAIAALVHERRGELARADGRPAPPGEDSEFMVRLAAAALLGDGIAGATALPRLAREAAGRPRGRHSSPIRRSRIASRCWRASSRPSSRSSPVNCASK
jgi:AcrR family transcriptional regulator